MNSIQISAVIITKNEQQNIERCLASLLGWVDDIVVYDSGSADLTIQIAKKMGVNTFQGEWLGFGATKKKASLLAKNDWILSIDADEEVSELLKTEIQALFSNLKADVAYAVPRKSYFLKKWIRFGGWSPDYQTRLFHRQFSMWNVNRVHEKVESKTTVKLTQALNHYVFKNISHQVLTNDRYSTLLAEQMNERGVVFNWFHFLTKPVVKFIECYFLKRGFLDGFVGYVIAKNASYSVFLKWAKMKEIQKNNQLDMQENIL